MSVELQFPDTENRFRIYVKDRDIEIEAIRISVEISCEEQRAPISSVRQYKVGDTPLGQSVEYTVDTDQLKGSFVLTRTGQGTTVSFHSSEAKLALDTERLKTPRPD